MRAVSGGKLISRIGRFKIVIKRTPRPQGRYRAAHRDRVRASVAKWRVANLELCRKKGRDYKKLLWAKPEYREWRAREARESYHEKPHRRANRLAGNRRYNHSEKGKHYRRAYEAKKRGDAKLDYKDWVDIQCSQNHCCAICKVPFDLLIRPQRDHIIPFKLGGRLVLGNVQALCKSCNSSKGAKLF